MVHVGFDHCLDLLFGGGMHHSNSTLETPVGEVKRRKRPIVGEVSLGFSSRFGDRINRYKMGPYLVDHPSYDTWIITMVIVFVP